MALEPDVPPISGITLRLFTRVVKRYFRGHFRAVMAQRAEVLEGARGPMIIYANHSSWWDPMICVLLARVLMPACRHYAPMDAASLARYPILKKIGIFPVEMRSARGAAQFLRTSQAVLNEGAVLWLTPQGRFADVREFPLAFLPGLAALTAKLPEVPVVPLAIEYTFWDERLPEALVRFGEPMRTYALSTPETRNTGFEVTLAATMLELQKASLTRDAHAFRVLLTGRRGVGGVYGLFRRAIARLRRRPVLMDHTDRSAMRVRR